MTTFRLDWLHRQLGDSVPAASLESCQRQLTDVTAKMREMLEKEAQRTEQHRQTQQMQVNNKGSS